MKRLLLATAMSALLLTGCAAQSDDRPTTGSSTTQPTAPSVSDATGALLARYRLEGKTTAEIIDHLDRMGLNDRPTDMKASIRPDKLVVTHGTQEVNLDIPADRFYLSVAPYVNRTHDCFYHSLTTCKGELAGKAVQVKIVDTTSGKVLVDETTTTFDNGFVGFWLPRNIEGTLRMASDGRVAETKITTGSDAPTCLTTLRLS
jgi:hypothetical protein